MRILFAIQNLRAGGAERQASLLCTAWLETGHEVVLVTLDDVPDHYAVAPSAVRHVLRKPPVSGVRQVLNDIRGLRATIRRHRPDVVVSFMDTMNFKVLIAAAGTGIPVLISERTVADQNDLRRSRLSRKIFRLARHILYPRADALVVQTRAAAAWARMARLSTAIHVIPNLLEPRRFADSAPRGKQILAVGRLSDEKGHDVLLEAFAAVVSQMPEWTLRIAGEGPERSRLETRIAALGLEHRVVLLGLIRDLDPEYRGAGIFVLPSRFEGFPNALMEALRAGCAVIASDGPAMHDMITPGENGQLFITGDAESLAEILLALASNEEELERYRAAAPTAAARYFPDAIMPLWQRILDGAIGP